ncbi:hypothetical protein I7I50_10709 [Histoplasma capsulatum G186AR]|uniref:Uncharacterized protein n=1 Tax=Ajellomyces capsulatus TaxID=5037 RepID=A0A8H7Z9Q9_AJECA|nr:hypothetical protein I7I52_01947 [Histoplasma capsulatum]QSS69423.1 hypothetical protein I7I50_10709 [Histoplasma capsulatum G186AR]
MSGLPKVLPRTTKEWEGFVAAKSLTNKTIHGADLASASNIGYEQFLLFRVLWRTYSGLKQFDTMFGMKKWISRAGRMLAGLRSWKIYCDSFGAPYVPEGTFAIARHYQMEVLKTREDVNPIAFSTPVAHRTRSKMQRLNARSADLQLETPSKKSVKLFHTPSLLGSPDDPFTLSDDESPDDPSPFKLISPVPKGLENVLYPPSKDEQIVNTALVVFLNALTIHFKLSSNWTLHRMAFIARFEAAQFEARTDGYLDTGHGKPSVLI